MKKKVLLTGIGGQSGSYLAEILLREGWDVYGVIRRSSDFNTKRIDHIFPPENKDKIFFGDICTGIDNLIYQLKPDAIINLAAQSHVKVSFDQPVYTGDANALGVIRILECIHRGINTKLLNKNIKFIQFSSSEMFGGVNTPSTGYTEESPFHPMSPYGVAKVYGYWITKVYRNGYGIWASNAIMFNKESPRRGPTFVTKKITKAAARIKLGLQEKLYLGNLSALRDWQHSKDAMEAVNLILQQNQPDDYIVSSQEQHTVKEFVEAVFSYLDLDWQKYVEYDPSLLRPCEVKNLLGNSNKIRTKLNWQPKYNFESLVKEMVDYDLKEAKKDLI